MSNNIIKPYKRYKGFRWRRPKYWRKHKRPWAIKLENRICNLYFTQKDKIRFLQQILSWFKKAPEGFKISSYLKEPYTYKNNIYKLNECDILHLSCRTYKAAWKKLLSKLNYELIDYEPLRRKHKYCLYFTFFFSNLHEKEKELSLDIICTKHNCYKILIILNGHFIPSFALIMENLRIWK